MCWSYLQYGPCQILIVGEWRNKTNKGINHGINLEGIIHYVNTGFPLPWVHFWLAKCFNMFINSTVTRWVALLPTEEESSSMSEGLDCQMSLSNLVIFLLNTLLLLSNNFFDSFCFYFNKKKTHFKPTVRRDFESLLPDYLLTSDRTRLRSG